jgi:hypothetical protein
LVAAAGLAAAALLGVLLIRPWSVGPASRAGPENEVPRAERDLALSPLKGSIDVRVFDNKNPARQGLLLDEPAAVPLRPGDQFCIEAGLDRPVYVYVLWIDPDGQVHLVYPWRRDVPRLGASTVGLLGAPVGQSPFLASSALYPGS